MPDTPLLPFPAPSFLFVLAPTFAANWIENVAWQAIGLLGNFKEFSRRLHAYLLLDESQLLFDEYSKKKISILRNCRGTVKCFEESL